MTYTVDPGLRDQVAIVLQRFPNLGTRGFYFEGGTGWNRLEHLSEDRSGMLKTDFLRQVATCLTRLAMSRNSARGLYIPRHSSYALKHSIENWVRTQADPALATYISNAAFIVAATIDGWVPVPDVRYRGPNCLFRRAPHWGGVR